MRIGVGSGNPVKRRAVEAVVEADVESVPVDSGVSEQPRGHAETVAGAENRARRARAAGDRFAADEAFDYGVGIEGGVAPFGADGDGLRWDGAADRPLYLVMWAAVTDGERVTRAAGPSLPLPDRVTDRVLSGEELGPVMDDLLGSDGVAAGRGAAGVLTGGRLDRRSALSAAVAGAFGPFRVDLYEPE